VQTVMFGAVSTSVGLADDLHKGLIERFRSLPMARCAGLLIMFVPLSVWRYRRAGA
jgi:ABC-2 type transport system permease protein